MQNWRVDVLCNVRWMQRRSTSVRWRCKSKLVVQNHMDGTTYRKGISTEYAAITKANSCILGMSIQKTNVMTHEQRSQPTQNSSRQEFSLFCRWNLHIYDKIPKSTKTKPTKLLSKLSHRLVYDHCFAAISNFPVAVMISQNRKASTWVKMCILPPGLIELPVRISASTTSLIW